MNNASTRRAIIIAFLLIFSPVTFANEKQVDSAGSNLIELNKPSSSREVSLSPNPTVGKGLATNRQDYEANQNKDKLTVFFTIGLVINIILMSLFAMWAVRQWRKSDKRE